MSTRSVLALLVLAACHRGPTPPDGDIAASLTAPAIGTHALDPASLRGKPSLVVFVSPTCPYCLATIPRAAAAATAEHANAVLVFVVGREPAAAAILDRTHWTGPALIDDGTLKTRYHVKAVPYTLVLGPAGHAREVLEGEQQEQDLRDALVAAQ
jgi:thiol-disulfide isomerase/thioredoxin